MQTVKKIISRIGLLAGVLFLLNFCYEKTFWKKDLDKHADMLFEQMIQEKNCDILYYGESSDFATDSTDKDKRSISRIASSYYPELKWGYVTRPAMHAGIYLAVIKHLSPTAKVKTVVVTLNLRSFDAGWINSNLESALQKSKIMYLPYPPLVNRFLYSLNVYENKTDSEREKDTRTHWTKDKLSFPYPFKYKNLTEWNNAMGNGGHLNADSTWNIPKIELACHYIKAYAFQIDPATNPRIKDFDEIVKVCNDKKLNVVFNLLAENMQYADSLVGKDLIYLTKQNRNFLVERYTKMGVLVADNLELVDGKEFIDQKWTTEHYRESGRKKIAKNLAETMKKIYPEEYK
jgi:hypothetical protein